MLHPMLHPIVPRRHEQRNVTSFRSLMWRRQLHRIATRTVGRRRMDSFFWKQRQVHPKMHMGLSRPQSRTTFQRRAPPPSRHNSRVPQRLPQRLRFRSRATGAIGNIGNNNGSRYQQLYYRDRRGNIVRRSILKAKQKGQKVDKSFNSDSGLWRAIGVRLTDKLRPNRTRTDIFNKEYRARIVRTYIVNGAGTGLVAQALAQEIQLPSGVRPIFGISIRPTRFENLRTRLGPWEKHLQHWQGTNGEILDKNKMVKDGSVVARLTRGEIGCYDAHYRLWRHMADNGIPSALILEDDADINYGHYAVDRINQMFSEIQKNGIQYDVIYLGHNNNKPPKKRIGACLGTPAGTQGLFMYLLTLEGARKLIANAIPMTQAVDDYVYVSQGRVRQFILEPRLAWVVNIERSDTASIK